jgi:hypothetical protein
MEDHMDPRKLFADERLAGLCAYCGHDAATRDHVPSRVLLDEPFPPDLPVVPGCQDCNNGFSPDEEYVACLIECAITGSSDPELVRRDKIKRILGRNRSLAARIAAGRHEAPTGQVFWGFESERVRNVVLKLARGHATYEYSEPQLEEPDELWFGPLCTMSMGQLRSFEAPGMNFLWPEIGSRAFIRAIEGDSKGVYDAGWHVVQEGRYRYSMSLPDRIVVRTVLSEYLACEVAW